jgi:hypothetical protein
MPERDDYLNVYLENFEKMCEQHRDAYNIHAVKLKNRHNLITLPLLIITSATGVIASLSIDRVAGIVVGASSAVLTAVQRYCSYAERSENARMTAKSYARIIRKIENIKLIIKSETVSTSPELFAKFLREIQAEIDSAQENANDVPWEILQYIDTIDATLCCVSIKGTR